MKQFILIAKDAKDDGAFDRRMAARPEHLKGLEVYRDKGNILAASAVVDDNDKMCGSVIMAQFPTRAEFDAWVAQEPFTVNKVWGEVTVLNGKLSTLFSHLIKS